MIKWAVSGTGAMASQFLIDSQNIKTGQFVAVYSQQQSRADAFAQEHGLANAYSAFDELLANTDIEAVYIAGTHENHASQAIQALNAGKQVLVEKPISLTLAEAEQVFATAKANDLFCAEALWTKFSPAYKSLMRQLDAGRIGEIRHISANFGFTVDMTKTKQRLINPEYAGGALLDIGLYPIFFPLTLFGYPQHTQARVTHGVTGVDIASDIIMAYNDGRSASLSYRFDVMMPTKAVISGTKGWVELDSPFFANNTILWAETGKPQTTESIALTNRGWGYEFEAVNKAIAAGEKQTAEHTWEHSLQLAKYLDYVRSTWGPKYPFER